MKTSWMTKVLWMGLGWILVGGVAEGHEEALAPSSDTRETSPPLGQSTAHVRSRPGENVWNLGAAPADWWVETERWHGHVGPWNVLGVRIGEAALRDFRARWGDHTLDVTARVPFDMPYTCLADGLMVGTGNTLGRLDLRIERVEETDQIGVRVRAKNDPARVVWYRPSATYLQRILNRPPEEIGALARECAAMPEAELFTIDKR